MAALNALVRLCERLEQAAQRICVHARARVAHDHLDHVSAMRQGLGVHDCLNAARLRELDRVGQEVGNALLHAHGVDGGPCGQVRVKGERQLQSLLLGTRLPQRQLPAHHVREIGFRADDVEFPSLDLRQVEHIVEQRHKRLAGFDNGADVIALLVVEVGRSQNLRHAEHPVQRRADFMAHVREEGRL